MLWIALFLPELPLQLVQRAQQATRSSTAACVITDGPLLRPLVHCANTAAHERGIKPSMPVAAARALAGDLIIVARDTNAETVALHNFACWAGQFTPNVTVQPSQGLLLEVGTTLSMHGGLSRLLVRIGKGLAALGYHAEPGIAPTPLAAWMLAKARASGLHTRMCRDIALLPERLASLPLLLLDWSAVTLQKLQSLGINTIGQCLQLPRDGFTHRFGHTCRLDLDKAIGHAPDPRSWFIPPATFASRLEFGFELNDAMMLLFPLKRLLQELEGFLRAHGAGVQEWQLLLEHMNHGRTIIVVNVATPERSAERFLLLAREKLAQISIAKSAETFTGPSTHAPVLALGIIANKLVNFEENNHSFLRDTRAQAIGWQHLIDRLVARLGSEQVYRLRVVDDHRPEQAWQPEQATQTASVLACKIATTAGSSIPRPLWLLRTPRNLQNENNMPLCEGRLHFLAGPERIEAGWWDDQPAQRDYYIARNPQGETLWVYRERLRNPRWYLHGVFA